MANWADVEFRKTTRYRCAQDFVSFAADILMLWDFLASLACGEMASRFWRYRPLSLDEAGADLATFLPEVVIGSLIVALCLRSATSRQRCVFVSADTTFDTARRRFSSAVVAFIAVGCSVQIGHKSAQIWIFGWFILFVPVLRATQLGLRLSLTRLEKAGVLREAIAIVGASGARKRLESRIGSHAVIMGFCEAPVDQTGFLRPEDMEKLRELGVDGRVDSVVVAFEKEQLSDISRIVERLKMLPMELAVCDEAEWPQQHTPEIRFLAGVPMRIVAKRPLNRRDLLIKTIFDKIGATILILFLLPLIVMIAILVAGTSRGPIIFRQVRQGWGGQRFTVFKFRTMHDAPHDGDRYTQTKRNDSRCTPFGRALRSTSLDELPQLWNVVLGDMSLVGPRPHADMLDDDDRAGREIVAEYAHRYRMKPGITGWAQIHGARGPTSTVAQLRRRVALDLHYIEHWSLGLDLAILARTPFCMIGKDVF